MKTHFSGRSQRCAEILMQPGQEKSPLPINTAGGMSGREFAQNEELS